MFWNLLAAPRWIVGGSAALIVFVGYSLGFKLTKEELSWTSALVIGAAGAVTVFLATVMGLSLRRRELRAVGGDRLSPARQAEAYRAVQRGESHPDPEIREVVLRIAEHRVQGARRQRTLVIVAGGLLVVSTVLQVVGGSFVRGAVSFIGVIAFGFLLWQLKTARRRAAELLRASAGSPSADGTGSGSDRRSGAEAGRPAGCDASGRTGGDAGGRVGGEAGRRAGGEAGRRAGGGGG
jgi:hypothetical protein